MTIVTEALSRPLACAASLGKFAADAGRFPDKRVLLTGEIEILKTANGRWIALDSLRLLMRICRFVDVWLPKGAEALQKEFETLAAEIAFTEPLRILRAGPEHAAYDAILSVGTRVAHPNATVANSNGWFARISSGKSIAPECNMANPIGALGAASFGVGEVFKRLVDVKPERGPYFDGLSFSFFSLEEEEKDPGPALPASFKLPRTLVTGQGAIGNSLVLLLGQLSLEGEILLLDRQCYGPENLGTCVLLGPDGIGKKKAEENARWLNVSGGLRAKPVSGPIEELLPAFGKELPQPVIVLNGLDNVEARHLIQELWPDVLIDGAIGDFSCQAAIHLWGRGMACLKCLFDLPAAPDPVVAASRATGLSAARVRDAEAVVDSADVDVAPENKRELLRANIGRQICSVVSEAMLARIAKDNSGGNFSPSVPFVATLSGTLVIAMLMKQLMGHRISPARYYVDILSGPRNAEMFNEPAKSSCFCRTRSKIISEVRGARAAADLTQEGEQRSSSVNSS